MAQTGEENFFRKKHTTTIAFIVAVLLFVLPFVEIRCNGITVAQNTGIGLAFGTDYKLEGNTQAMQDQFNSTREEKKSGPAKDSGKMHVFALVALILGVVGVAKSFSNIRSGIINTVVGALGALSLIALMIQLNGDIKHRMGQGEKNDLALPIGISIGFTVWFF